MFKNRFILILGALSLLLATVAVSQPVSNEREPGIEAGHRDPSSSQ